MRRVPPPPWSKGRRIIDPIYIDGRAERLRFAAEMLASAETTVEDDVANAELAVVTAERADTTKDDVLTTASHCRVFMDAHSSEFSREFLTRFVFTVDLLRRTPTPTMH